MSSVLAFLHRAGAFLLALMGGWDGTLRLLLVMMALDYLSGLVAACLGRSPHTLSGCIDSRAGLTGLLRKGLILMVLAVAAQIDTTIDGTFVRAATAWFYIVNEGISVLENAAIGRAFPCRVACWRCWAAASGGPARRRCKPRVLRRRTAPFFPSPRGRSFPSSPLVKWVCLRYNNL